MSTRDRKASSTGRVIVMATVGALLLTVAGPPVAIAGPMAPAAMDASMIAASGEATGFIAVRHRRYYRGGNAAGLAFMGTVIGAIGAIAAQQRREEYYEHYYYGPGYYGGGPYYYGGGPYYGRHYYRYYPY